MPGSSKTIEMVQRKKNGAAKRTRGKFFIVADIEHQEEVPIPLDTIEDRHESSLFYVDNSSGVFADDEDIEVTYSEDWMSELDGSGSGAGLPEYVD